MARPASPLALAIRKLLDQKKGDITYLEAAPLLKAEGHDLESLGADENGKPKGSLKFNMVKFAWKKDRAAGVNTKRGPGRPKSADKGKSLPKPKQRGQTVAPAAIDIAAAIKYVSDNGGLTATKAKHDTERQSLGSREAMVQAFEEHLASVQKAAS